MKRFLAWVYAVVSIFLMITPFIVGFIVHSIVLGFQAGAEANELLNNKVDKIMKSIGKN